MVGAEVGEGLLQVDDELGCYPGFDDDVVDVDVEVVGDLLFKAFLHAPLEGGPCVAEDKRHRGVGKGAKGVMKDIAS